MKINEIQQLEELSMNALPAMQTMFYHGWIIRIANGFTKRANSINPLYNTTANYGEMTAYCEKIMRQESIEITYKILSDDQMNAFDLFLEKRGYRLDGLVSVQVTTLTIQSLQFTKQGRLIRNDNVTNEWLDHVSAFNNISAENRVTLEKILRLIIPKAQYFMLYNDTETEVIACGMCVLERGYLGLFDIVTNEKYRGKGFGQQLVSEMLRWGIENGGQKAYLQVLLNNQPALKLYKKLGFKEKYTYWYRIGASH